MNGRLVFFSSANGDGAPRIYTLAKHLGWDLVKAMAATKPLRVQTPAGHHPGSRARRARRGLPAERQHRLALEAARQADRLCLPCRRRADRARRVRAACQFFAAARRRTVLRMVDGSGRAGNSRQGRQVFEPHRRRAARPAARRCRKLKLLTLDPAEYKKDRTKILDQMTGHLRR